MCAGDTSFIRVWDMHKELYKEYPTEANSCITSLTTSDTFTVAGFGDGSLRLFDFRCSFPMHIGDSASSLLSSTSSSSSSYQSSQISSTPTLSSMMGRRQGSLAGNKSSTPFYQHESYVLKVKLHRRNSPKLVSAGVYGGVNVFDLRSMKSDVESMFNREYATALECHPINDLIAV